VKRPLPLAPRGPKGSGLRNYPNRAPLATTQPSKRALQLLSEVSLAVRHLGIGSCLFPLAPKALDGSESISPHRLRCSEDVRAKHRRALASQRSEPRSASDGSLVSGQARSGLLRSTRPCP